jgi:Mor family transcriptional regulator
MSPPDTITPTEIRAELAIRFPKRTAQEIEDLTSVFVQLAGGKYVTGKRLEKIQRNAAICTLFDGANLRDLADRFGLSPRHLRRLIAGK